MYHVFSDVEGLRIAVEMERRGEDFYRRAAKVSRAPETVSLLNDLADDEVLHGREFQRLYDQACARRGGCDEAYDSETNAYLSAIAADIVFPGGLMALRQAGFEDPPCSRPPSPRRRIRYCSIPSWPPARAMRRRGARLKRSRGRSAATSPCCSTGSPK